MADEILKVDANGKPVIGLVTDTVAQEIRMGRIDDTTKGLKVMIVGGTGSGTVTSIAGSTGILLTPDPITTTGSVALSTAIQPIATLGSAGQSIRVNAGATALEYYTPSAGGIIIGTTTITSGTTTRILYNNAGVVGEYTISGTGNVAMTISPVFTTPNIGAATGSISGNAGTATALQNARTIGSVSFDGTANIVPQTIQSINEATDTTCFPLFISASGSQSLQPLNNTSLTFNSNTAVLGSTIFNAGTGYQIAGVATSRKMLVGNGTNFVASTETWAVPGTSGNVLTSDGTNWTSVAPTGVGTTCLSIIPKPQSPLDIASTSGNLSITDNTTMNVGQITIPFNITANKVSIRTGTSHTTDGTLDITLYAENGASQIFSVTTPTINASGTLYETALSAVVIPAGVYYLAVNGNSTVSTTICGFTTSNNNPFTTAAGLPFDVTSKPIMEGTLTITGDTPPATITPTSVTEARNKTLVIRLDN